MWCVSLYDFRRVESLDRLNVAVQFGLCRRCSYLDLAQSSSLLEALLGFDMVGKEFGVLAKEVFQYSGRGFLQ